MQNKEQAGSGENTGFLSLHFPTFHRATEQVFPALPRHGEHQGGVGSVANWQATA
jgi:hypothetical protein